jgi:predicted AAA+ superfamily ATPase
VRDLSALRATAVHLLTNTATLVSANRLAAQMEISVDLANLFCGYLEEAFLVSFLEFHSAKLAERRRRPRKVHAVDTGLRNAVSLSSSPDRGRNLETAVAGELRRTGDDGLSYWKGQGEVDLVVRRERAVQRLIQVTWDDGSDPAVRRRELAALAEAGGLFPQAERVCVTGEDVAAGGDVARDAGGSTTLVPFWRFAGGVTAG